MSVQPPPASRFAPGAPGQPPQPAPNPGPPRRSMRVVALGVGAAAVIALAIVVALALTLGQSPRRPANSDARPADAGVAFLTAVAAGDAARALALQAYQPTDRSHLTNEALVASRSAAPISEIRVVTDTDTVTEIAFRTGDTSVRALFRPVRQSDGTWKVDRGTTTAQVNRRRGLPVLIDGTPVTTDEVELFPGTHTVSTGLRNIAYADPTFVVADSQSFPRVAPAPRITDEGRQAFVAAARTALDACLQQKSLAPPDCPQNVAADPSLQPDLATIRWRVEGADPLPGLVPRISASDETAGEASLTLRMAATVTVRKGRTVGDISSTWDFPTTIVANLTREPVQARFRRG